MTTRSDVFARSNLLLIALLPHWLLPTTATASDNPAAAMPIRHAVYSQTSVELFWDRLTPSATSTANLSYRVTLNGQSVFNGPAISYFSNNLLPGKDYAFDVSAFADDNNLIGSGNLLVNTQRQPPLSLPKPANLRVAVYSPGVFDVFWDREAAPLTYEIYHASGALLGTTAGNSFYFDKTPAFDTSAVSLQIVATDNNGNRSEAATLLVEIGNPPTQEEAFIPAQSDDPLSIEGGASLLNAIHSLVFANPGNAELTSRFKQITTDSHASLENKGFVHTVLYSGGYSTLWSSTSRVDCPDGGSYEVFLISTRSGRDQFREYSMNNCQSDGVRHSGEAFTFTNEDSRQDNFQGSFQNYTLLYDDGRQVNLNTGWRPPEENIYAQTINLISNAVPDVLGTWQHALQGNFTINEANGQSTYVESVLLDWLKPTDGAACLQLSMRVNAPWTGYQWFQVDTYNDNWAQGALCTDSSEPSRFNSGYLTVSNGLGQSLTLEPDGASGYSLLAINAAGDAVRMSNIAWSDITCSTDEAQATTRCENTPPLF